MIVLTSKCFIFTGCHQDLAKSSLKTELITMESALSITAELRMGIDHIFTDYTDLRDAVRKDYEPGNWRIHNRVNNISNLVMHNLNSTIEVIPRDWNLLVDHLVTQGKLFPEISLFHQGRELPRWLMKLYQTTCFHFD